MLYDKHFEDAINLNERNQKAMEIKRSQSNDVACKVKQYLEEHQIIIGSSSSSNKRTLRQKAPAFSSKRQKDDDDEINAKKDAPQPSTIEEKDKGTETEFGSSTAGVAAAAHEKSSEIPIKMEDEEGNDNIMSTPSNKHRGRPRKSPDSIPQIDPKSVDDMIGKPICKLIDGVYYDGTVKKCRIDQVVNKRTGAVSDKIVYIILFNDDDIIECDDKKQIRKMIRLYETRRANNNEPTSDT